MKTSGLVTGTDHERVQLAYLLVNLLPTGLDDRALLERVIERVQDKGL